MIKLKQCVEHIKNGGALNVSGWCIKTLEELNDTATNKCMEVSREKYGDELIRSNSIMDEIKEYPANVKLISIDREDIDSEYTDDVVCPYCGYEHSDSWEFSDDCCDIQCCFCENTFEMVRNVSVTYSSSKK